MTVETKHCNGCDQTKPINTFHRNQSRCIDCKKTAARKIAPAKAIADRDRHSRLRRKKRIEPRYRAGGLVANAKHRAKSLGLSFELTPEIVHVWFVEQGFRCKQTGIEFDLMNVDPKRCLRSPSLDRIDSSIGYTISNTQLVCLFYNLAKNNSDDHELWSLMRQAVQFKGGA